MKPLYCIAGRDECKVTVSRVTESADRERDGTKLAEAVERRLHFLDILFISLRCTVIVKSTSKYIGTHILGEFRNDCKKPESYRSLG